ncbi:MAG: hypothetical protein HDR88_03570 [Bacteroides sp.]|nr:hypothetical protein [Bacteroides sp.]
MLSISGFATSCSNEDDPKRDDTGSKVELPNDRMFILNSGSMGANNSNISFYATKEDKAIADIFYVQNGFRLGDTGQDLIEDDNQIYVSVYGSNYLAKLNAAGVEQGRVSFTSDAELQGGVRYLAEEDNFIYASFHGGVVAKINKSNLSVVGKVTGLGANLEGVAIEDDKLYVANSYSQSVDPETGKNVYKYLDEMFVIDLKTFKLSETLTVCTNPNMVVEEDDKIFVIGNGNYADKGYELQMIDPKQNNKITSLAVATNMAVGNDKVYLVNSVTDWSTYTTTNTFFYYDIKASRLVESSFMKDAPAELASASIYMMTVDDETGDIYIGTSDYVSNGDIYRFKRDGSYVTKFDSGGINPFKAVFLDLH